MQKAGIPFRNISSDITTQPKKDNDTHLLDDYANEGCKIIVSLDDGKKIKNEIVKNNSSILFLYTTQLHSIDMKYSAEKNVKYVDSKKESNIVESRTKELETAKTNFLKDIKKVINLKNLNISGKAQFKKTNKLNNDGKNMTELNCTLVGINAYEKVIIVRFKDATDGTKDHKIDVKYMCFRPNEKSNSPRKTNSPKKSNSSPGNRKSTPN
jgi:hypothetical protein